METRPDSPAKSKQKTENQWDMKVNFFLLKVGVWGNKVVICVGAAI